MHEPGSIVQTLRDNLIVGLTNTKRSRYLISQEFRSLRAQAPDLAKKAARENYYDIHAQTKAQVDMMMELARKLLLMICCMLCLKHFQCLTKFTTGMT